MHQSVVTAAALLLVVVACGGSGPAEPVAVEPAPSFAREGTPDHENTRHSFTRTVTNPCPPAPEPVFVQGTSHYNAHFKFFDGGNDSRLMSHSHASGRGLVTGVKYQFHELWVLHGTFTYENGIWSTEQTLRYRVISQTGLGNFFSTMKMRVIVGPTDIQTKVISMEMDCRG